MAPHWLWTLWIGVMRQPKILQVQKKTHLARQGSKIGLHECMHSSFDTRPGQQLLRHAKTMCAKTWQVLHELYLLDHVKRRTLEMIFVA